MLSKNQLKRLRSLQRKKERINTGLFVVEGTKIVNELLQNSVSFSELYATKSWFKNNSTYLAKTNCFEIDEKDLAQISTLKTPNEILLVLKQKSEVDFETVQQESIVLALDSINDPGNLGTIIRLASSSY